ncbi:alpha/beta-hydrolase [Exidia glandulosa HHB12029]|uniref:Alpha/beta-hydrolase n=1 Tax=Exidia glandulosa HHB12029 TaxID=1314781 RepID=A0A165DRL6_EXIGL|nr:alpha/beta-hydrolase [Exidia glandulosa HHB12029]
MYTSFLSLSALLAAVLGSATHHAPQCTESLVPITASATNFDLSSGSAPPNATLPVSGTFDIHLRLCAPTVPVPSRARTLQVLIHGASCNEEYWDSTFKPETYSYVRHAAAQGYWTLNFARLGDGESARPDGIDIVQVPFEVALVSEIIKLARAGRLPGEHSSFEKVVILGHSFGSITLNNIVATAPDLVDAAIFTGFAHTFGPTDPITVAKFGPARDIDPRFADLPPAYLTTLNASTRAAAFYGAPDSYEPDALAWDEAHKDTTTTGEVLTFQGGAAAEAPSFTGDVFTINGDADGIFCTKPGCANLADEAKFYPAARSAEFAVIPGAGHSVNFHIAAPAAYGAIQRWLNEHGY